MYTYSKANCTEGFVGMVHGLAIFAALTNGWALEFVPDTPKPPALISIIADDHVLATVSEENAPEVFRAFRDWQGAERASSSEGHAWNRAIAAADEYLGENNFDELADSIELAD